MQNQSSNTAKTQPMNKDSMNKDSSGKGSQPDAKKGAAPAPGQTNKSGHKDGCGC